MTEAGRRHVRVLIIGSGFAGLGAAGTVRVPARSWPNFTLLVPPHDPDFDRAAYRTTAHADPDRLSLVGSDGTPA